VFAEVDVMTPLDIEALYKRFRSEEFSNPIYNAEISLSLQIFDEKNGLTIELFGSGRIICLGGKSQYQVKKGIRRLLIELKNAGFIPSLNVNINIKNYVATANIGKRIRLWKASYFLEDTTYNPKQQPWLIYRMKNPRVVFHLFENGKIVCTGAKKETHIATAIQKLVKNLKDNGLLKETP